MAERVEHQKPRAKPQPDGGHTFAEARLHQRYLKERAEKAEAQRDQARQEVLEEVAAEFERRAKEQVKNEAEWVELKMVVFTYKAAAAHCRGLATLDPSGEGDG